MTAQKKQQCWRSMFASENLYKQLTEYYQNNLSALYDKRDKLENQLKQSIAEGIVKEGTEAWYGMRSQINEVNETILDTISSIKDMSNEIANLDFEKFEFMQDKISDLASESDFYIDLIESMNKELYDDNGNFTKEGIVTVGLHSQNLNTYLQQLKDYADKIAEIEKEIADDPLNTTLIDKKKEYTDAQREVILSAQDERNAIADLIKDGYDLQSDALSEIIDKYKDLMSAQNDAYDYEKQMAEKVENLASLKKQYEAWRGDTSEEGMKVRQELDVQISEADEDIKQTEYEKLISDTEKLLDELQTDYEALINERIDNIDNELNNITSAVNANADIIANVLDELSKDTSLPLTDAMLNIWNNAQPVVDINSSVDNVNDTLSGTNEAIRSLRNDVQNILSAMNDDINKTQSEVNAFGTSSGFGNNSGNNSGNASDSRIPADNSSVTNGTSGSVNNTASSDWATINITQSSSISTKISSAFLVLL